MKGVMKSDFTHTIEVVLPIEEANQKGKAEKEKISFAEVSEGFRKEAEDNAMAMDIANIQPPIVKPTANLKRKAEQEKISFTEVLEGFLKERGDEERPRPAASSTTMGSAKVDAFAEHCRRLARGDGPPTPAQPEGAGGRAQRRQQ